MDLNLNENQLIIHSKMAASRTCGLLATCLVRVEVILQKCIQYLHHGSAMLTKLCVFVDRDKNSTHLKRKKSKY